MTKGAIHAENYSQASLEDWQRAFYILYGHIDDKRSLDSIWRHAMVNASKFSSDIRKNNFGLAFTHLAHILCWLLTFIERSKNSERIDGTDLFSTDLSFSDIVWEKYPGFCPYCKTTPCSCASPGIVENKRAHLEIAKGAEEKRPKSLDEWGVMFDEIYADAHKVIPIEALSFHLMEETGEVTAQMIRIAEVINGASTEHKKRELLRETADVFSWTCSIISKINRTYFYPAARHFEKNIQAPEGTLPTTTLSRILWDEYGAIIDLVCPTCHQTPCICDKKLRL